MMTFLALLFKAINRKNLQTLVLIYTRFIEALVGLGNIFEVLIDFICCN